MNKKTKKILGYLLISPTILSALYLLAVIFAPVLIEHGRDIAVGLLIVVVIFGLFAYGLILIEESS